MDLQGFLQPLVIESLSYLNIGFLKESVSEASNTGEAVTNKQELSRTCERLQRTAHESCLVVGGNHP